MNDDAFLRAFKIIEGNLRHLAQAIDWARMGYEAEQLSAAEARNAVRKLRPTLDSLVANFNTL